MNYQPHFKTLREAIAEAQSRHVIAVIKEAHSMKEAANTLGITQQYLRRLRMRYGLTIRNKRPSRQQQIAA